MKQTPALWVEYWKIGLRLTQGVLNGQDMIDWLTGRVYFYQFLPRAASNKLFSLNCADVVWCHSVCTQ